MEAYRIVKSVRKTIGIYILSDASVEVRCPKNADMAEVNAFVHEKQSWIDNAVREKRARIAERESFDVRTGTMLYFLGKPVTVKISHVHHIDDSGFYISGKDLKESAKKLYRRYAEIIIPGRVEHWQTVMGASVSSVKINGARTRWGSCSGKNALNFSWTLAAADIALIDYVVVHELAHTFEHNHSVYFWAIVERYIPDYKLRRTSLNEVQQFVSKLF